MPHSDRSLTHAAQDPATCLAPGLFRSLKRGIEKRGVLDITYVYGAVTFHFYGVELAVNDMRVLQVLVALAGIQKVAIPAKPTTPEGVALREWLALPEGAPQDDWAKVDTSFPQMLSSLQLASSSKSRKDINRCIKRLVKMSIWVSSPGEVGERDEREISMVQAEFRKDGSIMVLLNPFLARAALGRGKFARVDLLEASKLLSDPARLLHQRLSAVIDPGSSTTISLAKLCGYVWPDASPNVNTTKTRQQTIRDVLKYEFVGAEGDKKPAARKAAIDTSADVVAQAEKAAKAAKAKKEKVFGVGLGWGISKCGKGMYEFRRPEIAE